MWYKWLNLFTFCNIICLNVNIYLHSSVTCMLVVHSHLDLMTQFIITLCACSNNDIVGNYSRSFSFWSIILTWRLQFVFAQLFQSTLINLYVLVVVCLIQERHQCLVFCVLFWDPFGGSQSNNKFKCLNLWNVISLPL